MPSTAGLTYRTRPEGLITTMTSVACWTRARKRASLSPSTTRAWFVSSTRRVMRQATPNAATPVAMARTSAALEPELSRITTAGAAKSAVPSTTMRAPMADQAGVAAFPQRAHRRVHHRGREQEVGDGPLRIECASDAVCAVGDHSRVDHIGDEHQGESGEQQPRGGCPPRQAEHRVHDHHDEQDVHDRV